MKASIVKSLIEQQIAANKWIGTVPFQIVDAIFDNPYVNELNKSIDILIEEMFKGHADTVKYLFYELGDGCDCVIRVDNVTYEINDIDDALKYLIKECDFIDDLDLIK